MSETAKTNGPTGREWGEMIGSFKALTDSVNRLDRDVRDYAKKAETLEVRFATIKERMFIIGAGVAVAAGLGGGVVNEHWPKIAMREVRYERPDTQREKPVDLAADYRGGRYRRIHSGGNEPER